MFRHCGIICFCIEIWNCSDSVALFVSLLDFGTVPTVWHYWFFYWTLEIFRQSALFVFLWDFGSVPRLWHYLFFHFTLEQFRNCGIICFSFFYWTLELVWQYDIICFSIGLCNCSDSGTLFVSLADFGTVPRVWHYLFVYWNLEMFRQCGIICFSIGLCNCFDSDIICFSIGLWHCSDSVALFVFLLNFAIVSTVWHYLFFYWTLILFRQCGIICFY
jgi:hypothetical protein